jgi:hypothetical protein
MAARLIDRIEGAEKGAPARFVLPTSYVARESTAAPRARTGPEGSGPAKTARG